MTYKEASYYEMLEKAQAIHPKLVPHLNENGNWVFVLDTTGEETLYDGLSEKFKGTPAWEAFHTIVEGDSQLNWWADGRGYRGTPADILAPLFNAFMKWETDYNEQITAIFPLGYPTEDNVEQFRTEHNRISAELEAKYAGELAAARKIESDYENSKVLI